MITGKGLYAAILTICLITKPVTNYFAVTGDIKPSDALIFQSIAALIAVLVVLYLIDEVIKAVRGESEE